MRGSGTGSYYLSRRKDILDLYDTHSRAWNPFLARRYGDIFAETIIRDAREILEGLVPELPYIGGDENPMTRHIIRSSTSLALCKAMKARGKSAEEMGKEAGKRRKGGHRPFSKRGAVEARGGRTATARRGRFRVWHWHLAMRWGRPTTTRGGGH
jgi:hypothetical protein